MTSVERVSVAPQLSGIFGVKFPVRDLAASRTWYEQVFGLDLAYEFPDDDGVVRGVAYTAPGLGDTAVALRERPDVAGLSGFDPVIFAVDVGVRDRSRFAGKPMVSSGVKRPIDDADAMIAEALRYAADPSSAPRVEGTASEASQSTGGKQSFGATARRVLMTGVSYMIPFVAAGGLLIALGFLFGGYEITTDGVTAVDAWVATPQAPDLFATSTLYARLTVALLSDRDAAQVLAGQRATHLARMRELQQARREATGADLLAVTYELAHLDADLRWIEESGARLDQTRQSLGGILARDGDA